MVIQSSTSINDSKPIIRLLFERCKRFAQRCGPTAVFTELSCFLYSSIDKSRIRSIMTVSQSGGGLQYDAESESSCGLAPSLREPLCVFACDALFCVSLFLSVLLLYSGKCTRAKGGCRSDAVKKNRRLSKRFPLRKSLLFSIGQPDTPG